MKRPGFSRTAVVMIALAGSVFATPAWPEELAGQNFPAAVTFQGQPLALKGTGIKTHFFIKVLVAGFYTEKDAAEGAILDESAKRIEVAYFYPVPGKKLARETRERIRQNTTAQEYAKIEARINTMDDYFVDLRPGDRYVLTYVPAMGTFFTYNGKEQGLIEGRDFARALFSVWIGERPLSETLKTQLLGYEK